MNELDNFLCFQLCDTFPVSWRPSGHLHTFLASPGAVPVEGAAGHPRKGLAHRVLDVPDVNLLGGQAVVVDHLEAVQVELVHQKQV